MELTRNSEKQGVKLGRETKKKKGDNKNWTLKTATNCVDRMCQKNNAKQ